MRLLWILNGQTIIFTECSETFKVVTSYNKEHELTVVTFILVVSIFSVKFVVSKPLERTLTPSQ